jgi:hypothetical protein
VEISESRKFGLETASPLIQFLSLFGIPGAAGIALVQALQIPRFIYGQAQPILFAVEAGSLITVIVLVLALRSCLALPSAPRGFYRDVLDFLAMARWHPAVKAALVGLIVLPQAWYLRSSLWLFTLVGLMGRRALTSGDVQTGLDTMAVIYQLSFTGGVPLLFALHMLSRWTPKNRVLPWVLVPVLFVGTAIGVVVIVTIRH